MQYSMKILLIFFISLLTEYSFGQNYIDKTREKSKSKLLKYSKSVKFNTITTETDTTILLQIRDSSIHQADFKLFFDAEGICYKELDIESCDSCYKKMIARIIGYKHYRWVKVDDKTYISRPPYRLILTLESEGAFSYTIRKSKLAGSDYRRKVEDIIAANKMNKE